ncbi:hypothetical protein [Geobacillus subterraneus]|uniref:hypothetical protein n=1 Tax=Geobacillus subterraneus TaxID=129338 RepID=UPI001556E50B|nr:hypothetical protein [Geobacillus subterraneus]
MPANSAVVKREGNGTINAAQTVFISQRTPAMVRTAFSPAFPVCLARRSGYSRFRWRKGMANGRSLAGKRRCR